MYTQIKLNEICIVTVKITLKSVCYELNKKRFKIYIGYLSSTDIKIKRN